MDGHIVILSQRQLVSSLVFTDISIYTQGREVTRLLSQDAKSAWNWIKDCWPKTKPSLAAQSANTPGSTTIWTLGSRLSNVNVAALFTSVGIAVEIYKAYQGDQIDKELRNITEGITISNNLQAQGSGGPDGFARHVRDFVNLKIEQYSQDGGKHRFFVYHPDTLRDVGNLHRPCGHPWQREVAVPATLFGMYGPTGVGAMVAASSVAPLLALPVFLVTGFAAMAVSFEAARRVDMLWEEEPPALLG